MENWEYDIKCKRCGKVTRMFHSTHEQTSKADFKDWVIKHSTYPILHQCDCDRGMLMLHDLVSFGGILYL